jgi:uncharacterized protein YegP (UPF0339 family)
MINTENDQVEVFHDAHQQFRWRRIDTDNGKIVSQSSESYVNAGYAHEAAEAYNVGVEVVDA